MPEFHAVKFNRDVDSYYGEEYGGEDDEEEIDPNRPQIIRPDIEFELPDFVAQADEILEAELEAERERIRILNKTPVNFLNPRLAMKKDRAAKRKQQRIL